MKDPAIYLLYPQLKDLEKKPSEPPVRSSELVRRLAPKTSEKAKQEIVDLWLSYDNNEARLILTAFKIGLDEGRRESSNSS